MTYKQLHALGAALLPTLALGACGGSDNRDNGSSGSIRYLLTSQMTFHANNMQSIGFLQLQEQATIEPS